MARLRTDRNDYQDQCAARHSLPPMSIEKPAAPQDLSQHAEFWQLFASLDFGMLCLDANGRVLDANPLLCGLLQYPLTKLQGIPLWELGGSPNREADRLAVEYLQRNAYLRSNDLPLKSRNGLQIHFRYRGLATLADGAQLIECRLRKSETEHHHLGFPLPSYSSPGHRLLPHAEFEQIARMEIELTRSEGQPLSLMSIGIDRASKLRKAGIGYVEACASLFRNSDVVAKVDEKVLVALLTSTNIRGVLGAAERLRTAVAALQITSTGGKLPRRITVSIGTVTTRTGRTSYRALRSRADAKRDDAMTSGGNRVNT